MSSDPWGGPLLLQLILILINGWFAATEVAVLSLSDVKLRHDAEEGDKVAEQLLHLAESPNRFLSTRMKRRGRSRPLRRPEAVYEGTISCPGCQWMG